jgi:predicted type IV restriction endonuclease
MTTIPRKTAERLIKTVGKFQRILEKAKAKDINEADTVKIITDMLAVVFGYDKYAEITSEFAIRGTYCDLAILAEGKIQYIIEVKAIGIQLNQQHLKQAVDYCANKGVQWAVLTNGISWEIYRIRFEKPIKYDLLQSFNFLNINPKKIEDQEILFLLCKKGLKSEAKEEYYERIKCVNRFVIGALILNDSITNVIKRDLRKLSSGLKIDTSEIEKILRNEVIKREVLEGEAAMKAKSRVKRLFHSKTTSKPKVSKPSTIEQSPTEPSTIIKFTPKEE